MGRYKHHSGTMRRRYQKGGMGSSGTSVARFLQLPVVTASKQLSVGVERRLPEGWSGPSIDFEGKG